MRFSILLGTTILLCGNVFYVHTMTRQQIKGTMKIFKNNCMPKNDVTEDQVGSIEQGQFIEDRNVMCYIACIYTMSQVVKNNKLVFDGMIKQVDIMFPPDLKDPFKASIEKCKKVGKKYDDLCEASFWSAKCMYEADPEHFVFA